MGWWLLVQQPQFWQLQPQEQESQLEELGREQQEVGHGLGQPLQLEPLVLLAPPELLEQKLLRERRSLRMLQLKTRPQPLSLLEHQQQRLDRR